MEPVLNKSFSRCGFRLCDFIVMVDWNVIDSAGVNVERFAEVFHRHRRAFNMPTRETDTPRRWPFLLSRRLSRACQRREFPQSEVSSVFFLQIFLHPRTFFEA